MKEGFKVKSGAKNLCFDPKCKHIALLRCLVYVLSMLAEVEDPVNGGLPPSAVPASPPKFGDRFPLAAGFAASSISVAAATFLTNWIDVIKVRQQVAGAQGQNLFKTGVAVVKNDGVMALQRGVTPAVVRGMLYGGTLSHSISFSQSISLTYDVSPRVIV